MSEMNETIAAFAELCEASDAIEDGKAALDPQASIEAAEAILDYLGIFIAVCAVRGGRPKPPPPANLVGDTDLYE
jgi:hypothetical protein